MYKQGWLQLIATLSGKTRTISFYTHNPDGIGTEANPYPIDNFNDLTIFRRGVNSKGRFNYKHYSVPARALGTWFQQTADISLASVTNWRDTFKIGNAADNTFAGIYDGGGHAVTDLKITSGESGGFFGFIEGGAVKNLDVVVAAFTPGIKSGPLCAQISGSSSVDNCRSIPKDNSVVLKLKNQSGGLIGKTVSFRGTISHCQNRCNISADGDVYLLGGVIGYNESVDSIVIRSCQNYGSMTGVQTSEEPDILVDKAGGITSQMEGLEGKKVWFDSCTNYGTITMLNNYNGLKWRVFLQDAPTS